MPQMMPIYWSMIFLFCLLVLLLLIFILNSYFIINLVNNFKFNFNYKVKKFDKFMLKWN